MRKTTLTIGTMLMAITLVTSCKKEENMDIVPDNPGQTEVSVSGYQGKSIETLTGEFIKTHPEEEKNASKIISVTSEFFAINGNNKEFGNKKPCHIQPIYAYGVDGVAYYEVWFTENNKNVKGWILISATEKDYPLVNFSQGIPYSSHLITANTQNNKIYRFGASFYAMEQNGNKVAEYGSMPKYILNTSVQKSHGGEGDSKSGLQESFKTEDGVEGVDYFLVNSYESLKTLFPQNYYSQQRAQYAAQMQQRLFPASGHGEARKTAGYYQYRWVGGQQAYYTQIPAYTGWNPYACWSGCNNNAWTNIYGWWDKNAGKASLIPTTSFGETSPIYRNTASRQNSIDPVQMYIRGVSSTYCGDGTGWTLWSDTYKGYQYAPYKGYGYLYQYRWCNSAGCNVDLANIVTDGIANNYKPVYVGANSHAYVGYGWAQWTDNTDWTWAYCYPGWSENNNDDVWIWWHDFNASVKLFVY